MITWVPIAVALAQAALPVAPPAPPAPPPAPPALVLPETIRIAPAGDGSGTVAIGGVTLSVRFEVATGDRGEIVFRAGNGFRYGTLAVNEPGTALLVLADRQFQFLAPALLAWAGPDLVRLRDRRIAQLTEAVARLAPAGRARNTSESAVRPALAGRLQLASALAGADRPDDALAVMAAAGPRDPQKGGWQRLEHALIATRLANIEHGAGRTDAAIARLRTARAAMKPNDRYALNIDTNLAAILAESGQAREALALVEQTTAALPRDAIAGSSRYFAWIRACAFKQLGREAEARAEYAGFVTAAQPWDRSFTVEDNVSLAARGLACLGDVTTLVDLLIGQARSAPFGALANLWVQPGYGTSGRHAAFRAAVAQDSRLQAATTTTAARLGPALGPALRGWRAQ